LISTTEFHQLLKLPFMVEHFIEHKQQNSKISFVDFLTKHYVSNNLIDDDYEKDMQLPFKSYEGCASMNILAFVPNLVGDFVIKPHYVYFNTIIINHEDFLTSSFLPNIWQPPKFS
jgi:hypothetical protein